MSTAPKPLRLRSACTECHAAKVRCSGEKDGCTRCRRNGLYCEYQVSMVGRAPKKQKTGDHNHTKSQNHAIHTPEPSQDTGPSARALVSVPLPMDSPSEMNIDHLLALGNFLSVSDAVDSSQNYLADLPVVSPELNDVLSPATANILPDAHPGVSNSESSEGTWSDRQPASLASSSAASHEDMLPSLLSQNTSASSFRSQLWQRSAASVPKSYRDKSAISQYRHAATLMDVIECLECHLQSPRAPIDQGMRLNREAMAKVRDVLDMDEFWSCQSCPLLVATIMDLVVGLYELVIFSIHQPSTSEDDVNISLHDNGGAGMADVLTDSSPGSPATRSTQDGPLFQFGCLEFDPDEQELFRNVMVRRDLRRCIETIRYCSQEICHRKRPAIALDGTRIRHGGSRSKGACTDHVQLQWYQEMEHQATQLLASLPAKYAHGQGAT
ncbi:hypothetical protein V1525DRAFT_384804 [Lipomyces kononenkoae]|uniref:Uncharacterized protein n=1 Tax=Lipomyces kononenkoae TaxID=34357 RepID=A0ACC3TC97_LIPKO